MVMTLARQAAQVDVDAFVRMLTGVIMTSPSDVTILHLVKTPVGDEVRVRGRIVFPCVLMIPC